jgi:hypothetical protein
MFNPHLPPTSVACEIYHKIGYTCQRAGSPFDAEILADLLCVPAAKAIRAFRPELTAYLNEQGGQLTQDINTMLASGQNPEHVSELLWRLAEAQTAHDLEYEISHSLKYRRRTLVAA